ncbi:DNA (cytosine-5)-methyltransferase 1 [Geodermatophilus bullaregiensis]|uniref:DNA cytosine methyltransferase n=1 Tax=Geodermatophilus bullaregiensis TaxID=1564160 RepID=UPI00195C8A49|nr:DNA cytosine methyltransferase [Geodermatophilus bullaregiensis]MBM7804221.1 DNA (cytosine-5)-methyltransferase 1 [Geodermatophilus bullaregiensis]
MHDERSAADPLTVAGLFAGIGGVELGFARAGIHSELLCEVWDPAKAVLAEQFPDVPLADDVRTLDTLPPVDVVAAGFPCQDLSQAGRTAGIHGEHSGLVGHVFRLLESQPRLPKWIVFENVRNMLPLDKGKAMAYLVRELEDLGLRWAYRLVDSRFSGVPQRRQRVLLVASPTEDPRYVLFADDAGEPEADFYGSDAFGFYWTEGLRGLGWAPDAVPTLKGGSTLGIPSPPAVWVPGAPVGRQIVTPTIEDAERLQGFPTGWTEAGQHGRAKGPRWKLVGNAVTVGVAEWLGSRLRQPGTAIVGETQRLAPGASWPTAASGEAGTVWRHHVSMWPVRQDYQHLPSVVDLTAAPRLSHKAAAGFFSRTARAKLRFKEEFLVDMKAHVEATAPEE